MPVTTWIIFAIIGIIVLAAIIFGIIAVRNTLSPQVVPTPTPVPVVIPITPLPTPTLLPTSTPTPTPQLSARLPRTGIVSQPTNTKIFFGQGFSLAYPAQWGLLTCINSSNIEFDPLNNTDQLNTVCSFAQKPITLLVSNTLNGCFGENVTIGDIPAVRSLSVGSNFATRQWCTVTNPVLKISHRFSSLPTQSSSQTDFSPDIEAMISTIQFTNP